MRLNVEQADICHQSVTKISIIRVYQKIYLLFIYYRYIYIHVKSGAVCSQASDDSDISYNWLSYFRKKKSMSIFGPMYPILFEIYLEKLLYLYDTIMNACNPCGHISGVSRGVFWWCYFKVFTVSLPTCTSLNVFARLLICVYDIRYSQRFHKLQLSFHAWNFSSLGPMMGGVFMFSKVQ